MSYTIRSRFELIVEHDDGRVVDLLSSVSLPQVSRTGSGSPLSARFTVPAESQIVLYDWTRHGSFDVLAAMITTSGGALDAGWMVDETTSASDLSAKGTAEVINQFSFSDAAPLVLSADTALTHTDITKHNTPNSDATNTPDSWDSANDATRKVGKGYFLHLWNRGSTAVEGIWALA